MNMDAQSETTKKRYTLQFTTATQFEVLVREMENMPDLARGVPVFGSSRIKDEEEWERVRTLLNSKGPPVRSLNEWKKIWRDLKSRVKKKLGQMNEDLTATGGGPSNGIFLTPLEEAVARVLQLRKAAQPAGAVFGRGNGPLRRTPYATEDTVDEQPSTSAEKRKCPSTRETQMPSLEEEEGVLDPAEGNAAEEEAEEEGPQLKKRFSKSPKSKSNFHSEHLSLLRKQISNHTILVKAVTDIAADIKVGAAALQQISEYQKQQTVIAAEQLQLQKRRDEERRREAAETLLQLNGNRS